jgi:16S rRNA (cytosine1402-N4)-methyltransferase
LHVPVLLRQVLEVIDPKPGQIVVDCTLGLGGHSSEILARLKPGGLLIGIDFDPSNIADATIKLHRARGREGGVEFKLFNTNFAGIEGVIAEAGVEGGQVDAVLADIGVASTQIDDPARGFSYRRPGPLDMRMDPTRGSPASSSNAVSRSPFRRPNNSPRSSATHATSRSNARRAPSCTPRPARSRPSASS